jgi:hypothetical protein
MGEVAQKGGKVLIKGIIIFALMLSLGWAPGIKTGQAGNYPVSSAFPISSSWYQPSVLDSKPPMEILLGGEVERGQNYPPGGKFDKIRLTGTASLTDNPEVVTPPRVAAKLNLSKNSELRISFLYNKENPAGIGDGSSTPSHLLFKYDMDYQLMPNLQVGVSGYLYQPYSSDYMTWRNSKLQEPLLGLGPGIRYNLGQWSFILKSQLQTSSHTRSDSLQSWFRVWYAF